MFTTLSTCGKRHSNEDACAAERIGDNTYFFAVADGMGGIAGGKIASEHVISAIREYFNNIFKSSVQPNDLKHILEKAFLTAQTSLADKVFSFPELKGMGTTLSILLLHDQNYVWGNIGDSRIYLMHGDSIELITTDHTYVAEYLSRGKDELPRAVLSQYGNIVTRIIDGGIDKPDIYPSTRNFNILLEGDVFLICSDGLIVDKTENIDQQILTTINKTRSLWKKARNLASNALKHGSEDNITVVLARYGRLPKGDELKEAYTKLEEPEDPKTIRIVIDNPIEKPDGQTET